ncbi:MAG: plasmid pRiA4b ORF-3 family protein [Rhodococcus sp. (in: high G+C Gram-positive bacteria)]|uniref:plasmid pRiA4b ORF-3 family protein n=1 Tax=Rhodococcus sp. TaxID=1831 RepID=UPI003BAF6239
MTARDKRRHLNLVTNEHAWSRAMPSRRAPRTDVVTYRLRIELEDVSPPIWREFLVPSNLPLDQLHPVLQGVMGWLDSHMHSWVGGEPPLTERYVMRESLDDSFDVDDEVCDDAVRVDQVLSEVGDQLSYEYDFGDGWGHTIVLEEITDGPAVVPSCIAGARACPPEDSGGPFGYLELLNVLADPAHPEHHGMRLWVGPSFSPESFDVESVNADLRAQNTLFMHGPVTDSKFAELLSRMSTRAAPQVFSLLGPAELTNPRPDLTEVIEKATAHLAWLLNRIGPDGVELTKAGYLPPADVVAARAELPWANGWIGNSPREMDNPPIQNLRKFAKMLGLVRKYKGRLVRTNAGSAMAHSPYQLWCHLLERLPFGTEPVEHEAGRLVLLTLAAGTSSRKRDRVVAEGLTALGWRNRDGTQITAREATWVASPTVEYIEMVGAIVRNYRTPDVPTDPDWGRVFAKMVLSM